MKKYEYNIGEITRACGHKENAGIIKSSCGYEPKAREWETQKLCKECNIKLAKQYNDKVEAMRQKALKYCQEHNINKAISNITAYENNAEIIIYIK